MEVSAKKLRISGDELHLQTPMIYVSEYMALQSPWTEEEELDANIHIPASDPVPSFIYRYLRNNFLLDGETKVSPTPEEKKMTEVPASK